MENPILILTATVNAQNCMSMVLRDKQQRIDQYSQAIEAYLNDGGFRIVFSENSLCDLDVFQARFGHHPNLELITFDGNHFTHSHGKGQGENESITYALLNSRFLTEESIFFKVSGRYHSSSIKTIMTDFSPLLCDGIFEQVPSNQAASNVLTVFFGLRKDIYLERITGAIVDDRNGLIFERVMFINIQDLRIQWIDPITYDPTMIGGSGQMITKFS